MDAALEAKCLVSTQQKEDKVDTIVIPTEGRMLATLLYSNKTDFFSYEWVN